MSTAAITRVLADLWPSLRGLLLKLGRWILERLARKGLDRLRYYMDDKIDDFQRRLSRLVARRKRVKTRRGRRFEIENWRVHWLRGRIKRWRLALKWLSESTQAQKLKGEVIDLALERARREIPEHAPDEDFTKWLRKRRKAA